MYIIRLRPLFISVLLVGLMFFLWGFTEDLQSDTETTLESLRTQNNTENRPHIILGYVTDWSMDIPDPYSVSHLAYAFATINDDYTTLNIKKEERFRQIVNLKDSNPCLKVLLSIGGWGAGNFSEMASTEENRSQFIKNAMYIQRQYGIDGFDIDWEFPGSSLGKISSTKNDKTNFTKLIRQFRDSLGNSGILTFASPSNGKFYEYDSISPYVDFVNVMAYDMGTPPRHHSPLNHSALTGRLSVKDVIANHYKQGVPVGKIVLGVPFYGRGNKSEYKNFQDYRGIKILPNTEKRFDSIAYAPYIADSTTGELLLTYDDSISVKAKCELIKEIGAGGIMFWHYGGDTKDHTLLRTIHSILK